MGEKRKFRVVARGGFPQARLFDRALEAVEFAQRSWPDQEQDETRKEGWDVEVVWPDDLKG